METTPETTDRGLSIKIPVPVWEQLHRLAYDTRKSKQALVIEAIAATYGPATTPPAG